MARLIQLEIDFAAEVPVAQIPHDEDLKHPSWCIASCCCICKPEYQEGSKECETQCPLSNKRDDPAVRWLDEYEKSMKAMAYVCE